MPPRKRNASETTGSNLPEDKDITSLSSPPTKQRSKRSKPKDESTNHPFQPYPIHKVNRLIEPGPVLLVTTGSLSEGTHNVMTIGFHMMMQHEAPTLIGVSIGPWDASYATLKKRRECVLAIPSVELASTVVDIGNCSGSEVDKWSRFGLEAVDAGEVSAPLVGGEKIIANIECVVEDTKMVSKYSMWVLRVVAAWENVELSEKGGRMFHHLGDGTFAVDGEKLDLRERMVKWKEFQD